jgi:branched-chain amino acid transport system substrate-binding protein
VSVTRRGVVLALVLFASLAGLEGCGGGQPAGDRIRGEALTIYSSVPLHGASGVSGQSVVAGERIALATMHGRVGKYRIVFKPLDDSTPQRAGWDPGQTTQNALLAAADHTTIGYIGEYNSGASAISIPLLNRNGIPQISPSSSAVGLTSSAAGASPGEPEKYYPTGSRTFSRVVPSGSIEAIAQVRLQRSLGCKRTFVLQDGEVDGEDTAITFALAAQSAGLPVAGIQEFARRANDYRSLAASVSQTGARCILISADTESGAVALTEQVASAIPAARIFGSTGVAESTYTDPTQGGIPSALDGRVLITAPMLAARSYPSSGRAFLSAYARRFGPPEPSAIFGYEAMSLMLNAIARATDDGAKAPQRSKVAAAVLGTRDHRSVLGTYSINRNGDTSIRSYGAYRVAAGQLSFWKALEG